ncbi:MAG: hypothetical protein KC589_07605 [Nanoarchaeota archaeon]|nr:hypothetical protein [Nanoarchaeota archaeon]
MCLFRGKKGIETVVSVLLILFIVVLAFSGITIWFNEYQSSWEVKSEISDKDAKIELLGLKRSGSNQAELGLKAKGEQYHILTEVYIGEDNCTLLNSNVVDSLTSVLLNCSVSIDETYEVNVYTENGGLFEKSFTVYE